MKSLKILLSSLLLVAGALYLLLNVVDPNRYRAPLQQLVLDQTGLELQIAGDLSWSWRPDVALSVRDVRLRNPAARQELASFNEVAISVAPLALLRGELQMQALLARNLHINWYINEQGQSNWPLPETNGTSDATTASDQGLTLGIEQIRIENASLSVRDRQRGLDLDLRNMDLQSRGSNFNNRPFSLSLQARYLDNRNARDLPLQLRSEVQLDLEAGNLGLNELQFHLSPVQLDGQLQLRNLHQQAPEWQVALNSNTFNVLYLLENFMTIDAGAGVNVDSQQLSLRLEAHGDQHGATLEALDMRLDNSPIRINGDVLFPDAARPLTVAYQMQAEHLNLEPFIASINTEESAAADNGDDELPFDRLRELALRGSHDIDQLQVAGLTLDDLSFDLIAQSGILRLISEPVTIHGGAALIDVSVDANAIPATINSRLALQGVRAEALAEALPALRAFGGELALLAEHQLQGDSINALLNSVTGSTVFDITQGSADITLIKRVFEAIAVLSPSGAMAAGWPDVINFAETHGELLFTRGLASGQQLLLDIGNINLEGEGGVDLQAGSFDYRMRFTVLGEPAPQTVVISDEYQDIAWPVRCSAAFADSVARYCSPDLQQAREMFGQIARDEIERRAQDIIDTESERLQDRASDLFDRLRR